MAIAGSMTTAYKISFLFGALSVVRTTYERVNCVNPQDAVARVRNGEEVVVMGSDMAAFNEIWEALV